MATLQEKNPKMDPKKRFFLKNPPGFWTFEKSSSKLTSNRPFWLKKIYRDIKFILRGLPERCDLKIIPPYIKAGELAEDGLGEDWAGNDQGVDKWEVWFKKSKNWCRHFFFEKLKPGQQWDSINLQVGDVLLNNMTLMMIHMEPLDKKCPIYQKNIFGQISYFDND